MSSIGIWALVVVLATIFLPLLVVWFTMKQMGDPPKDPSAS